ncbi:MAG: hypothetical protein NTU97_03990 [Candidatus Magasanikbacteria bacterium]|nr:hypothetical protein [Candidatus Magasanikbacteria bacterium]
MFLKRILPFLTPALFWLGLELANKFPGQMLYWGLAALFLALISLWWLHHIWLKEKHKDFKIFWLSSFLFLLGTFLTFIFLDRPIFRQVLIFVSTFLLFLEIFYACLFLREKKEFYLGNLTVLNEIFPVLAFFLLAAGFFGWLIFLSKILWIFVILISFVALETSYNLFYNVWGRDFSFARLWVVSLVIAEMFWALDFLPVGFLVKSLVLTICWWLFSKILIEFNQEHKKKIKIYLSTLVAFILIIIILLLARWI